jgi:hypothetical protein
MLTVINADGSCYREFAENADSAFLSGDISLESNPFPADIDSTWEFAWSFKNSGLRTDFPLTKTLNDSIAKITAGYAIVKGKKSKDHVIAYGRKQYKSVKELNKTFKFKKSKEWSKMQVRHKLDMNFRWFYTYYHYSETYPKLVTNFELPIENYLTKDEAQFWFTGEPNILQGLNGVEIRDYVGALEDKYRKWFNQNTWNAQYKVLIANYNQIKNQPVSIKELESLRDTIFDAKVNDVEDFKMKKILDDYFKTNVFSQFWKSKNNPMEKYEDEFGNQEFIKYFGESFNYKLILPGEIIQPNNAILKGDTLIWKLTAYRMIPSDYVIQAQSRRANIWAFILTGLIFIVAIGSFIWKSKSK